MTTDRNSDGAELLPCPFCGGEAAVKHTYRWWVECLTCGVATPDRAPMDRAGVVAEWNRRLPERGGPGYLDLTESPPASIPAAEVQALVERLRAKVKERDTEAEKHGEPVGRNWHQGIAEGYEMAADELAKLIPRGAK